MLRHSTRLAFIGAILAAALPVGAAVCDGVSVFANATLESSKTE